MVADAIRNVVNIGIGGSHLGPEMATIALSHYSDRGMNFRFVSNVDGSDFAEKTLDLDPEETLFIIVSKTFVTLETLTNAGTAREWIVDALGEEQRRDARPDAQRVPAQEMVKHAAPLTCQFIRLVRHCLAHQTSWHDALPLFRRRLEAYL